MAETIKGLNVVIGAETTGLSKALADVNKHPRDINPNSASRTPLKFNQNMNYCPKTKTTRRSGCDH